MIKSRSFTPRERILLLCMAVILVVTFYMKLVYLDVADIIDQYPFLAEDAQQQLAIEQQKYNSKQAMLEELETLRASGAPMDELPKYDNLQAVMESLSSILRQGETYSIQFLPLEQADNMVRRKLSLQFTCHDYQVAEQIVMQINHLPYKCQVTAYAIQGGDSLKWAETISVRIDVTFFELSEQIVASAPAEQG